MEEQRNVPTSEVDDQKPVTKKVLVETLHEFRKDIQKDIHTAIDERVPKIIDERVPKILEREMPVILGQFTDEVLMPAIMSLIQAEFAKFEYRMKVYIDNKIADLRGDRELFRKFMVELVALLRRHRVGTEEEISSLTRFIPQR